MTETATTVTVRILDKEYQVSCPGNEVDELAASARFLDGQMRSIRESGKVFGLDRIAVMAALNITHDYLKLKNAHDRTSTTDQHKIIDLTERVARALAEQKQLNL